MITEQVKEYISALAPGTRLPNEVDLGKRFNMSRSNIREIIRHISELGVIERSTKRGTFVKKPSTKDVCKNFAFQLNMISPGFEELKDTRLFLECSIVSRIIKFATPTSIEHLKTLTDQMEATIDDPEKADDLDSAFHLALAEICGNRLIKIFFEVTKMTFISKFRKKFLSPKAKKQSIVEHREMIEHIIAKDENALRTLIEKHITAL